MIQYFKDKNCQVSTLNAIVEKGGPSEHVKNAMKKKWEVMLERYEYDPSKDFRLNSDNVERSQPSKVENAQKDDTSKDFDAVEEKRMNVDDVRTKLDEVTKLTLRKSRARSHGDGTALLSKAKKNEGIVLISCEMSYIFLPSSTALKVSKASLVKTIHNFKTLR